MQLNENTQRTIEELGDEMSKEIEAMREAFLGKLVTMHDANYAKLVDAFSNSHMFSEDILTVCAMAGVPEQFLDPVKMMCTQFVSMWSMYATELAGIDDMKKVEEMMEMSVRLRDNMRGIMARGTDNIKAALQSEDAIKH